MLRIFASAIINVNIHADVDFLRNDIVDLKDHRVLERIGCRCEVTPFTRYQRFDWKVDANDIRLAYSRS